jgi:uncharacterized protein (DUF2252 family)
MSRSGADTAKPDPAENSPSAGSSAAPTGAAVAEPPQAWLAEEFWLTRTPYDPRLGQEPWKARHAAGKALRAALPREAHAEWQPAADRPDPLDIIRATNAGRQEGLIPLRMARMAASPFAFLRGAAAIMALDLARTATTGIPVIISGDAHLHNFGLYATPEGDVVFDLNDFDESVPGPWEWDLKRLVASVSVAGREIGLNGRARRRAVRMCALGYCRNAAHLERLGVLETWSQHFPPERLVAAEQAVLGLKVDPATRAAANAVWREAVDRARQTTHATLLPRVARPDARSAWRFIPDPPVLTEVSSETASHVVDSLVEYAETLTQERRFMLHRYRAVDVAHRVVGVGSVGLRSYLVLLFGNGEADPLFLQVKEATEPASDAYLSPPGIELHQGRRVVTGQRFLQVSTDFMLGWTSVDGRPYYVRQMKNMKGSVPIESLSGRLFEIYAFACGAILARGHARTGDIARIAGYCGRSPVLGRALAEFAEAYADQNAKDHAELVKAIADRRVAASDAEPG